jgi:hypothetical protein
MPVPSVPPVTSTHSRTSPTGHGAERENKPGECLVAVPHEDTVPALGRLAVKLSEARK